MPKLLFTDGNCVINNKKRPGIGLLLNVSTAPILEPTDFLIYKAVTKNDKGSSVQEYGRILRMYWEFLSTEKVDWLAADDNLFVKWRDMMDSGQRVSRGQKAKEDRMIEEELFVDAGTINNRIGTVFDFYKWAKENGRAPAEIIGQPSEGQAYAISANKSAKGKWSWPYLLRAPAKSLPNIPVKDDIDELHNAFNDLFTDAHAWRNRLLADWMEFAGTRGIEASSLTLDLIPTRDEIEKHIEQGKPYTLDFSPKRKGVSTKRGKARPIDVDPILLKFTLDYIELERVEIVENTTKLAAKKGTKYSEPKQIFLSLTTGCALSKKTIQNEFSRVCKLQKLNLSAQGLRRYYAMTIVSNIYLAELKKVGGDMRKVDINTIILYAQQQLGHSHASTTIRSYINVAKLDFMAKTVAEVGAFVDRRKSIIERQLIAMQKTLRDAENKLRDVKGLHEAVLRNDKDEAMELLKSFYGVTEGGVTA